MKNPPNSVKTWLVYHDRSATWLGKQIGIGASHSADIVAGRKRPSLAQRIAIEVVTDGGVGRAEWAT